MADPSMEAIEALIRETAETVILPRFRALEADDVDEKTGPGDLVTIADREAETRLTEHLEAMLPGSRVVGEEAVSAGITDIRILKEEGDFWLVDPVDGTGNFVRGEDRFAVMVAQIRGGEVIRSWIHPPVDGRIATSEKGSGGFFGGDRIEGKRGCSFDKAHGDYSSIYIDEPWRSHFDLHTERAGSTRQGRCSAYAYLETARGQLDFVLQYRMTAWDHAAGQLLVEEAGGRFGFLPGGEPYTPIGREDRPMLVTSDADMWADYARHLLG